VGQYIIDRLKKKSYDSVRRKVSYNSCTKFGVSMKIVRFINVYLYETYSKIQ